MPTNIYTPEFPSVTGVLDEDALVVGHFADAHVLRSIGNASNRLAGRGNYLVHEVFRRAGNDEQIGTTGFYVYDQWQRIRSFPLLERKAHLNRADVRIRARITNGATVVFQLTTEPVSFRQGAKFATTNTIVAVGTGNFELYEGQIELGRSSVEDIELWVWGSLGASLMSTAVYGSPNAGGVNDPAAFVNKSFLYYSTSTWNGNIQRDRIVVAFLDSGGNELIAPMRVDFDPPAAIVRWAFLGGVELSSDQVQLIQQPGAVFQLWEAPRIRLGSVTIRERDAYAT